MSQADLRKPLLDLCSAVAGRKITMGEIEAERRALDDYAEGCHYRLDGMCRGYEHRLYACRECMDMNCFAPKTEGQIEALLMRVGLDRRTYGDF